MGKYYDGTKLLSMMDINGKKPEIYMTTTNRSAGKTTFFNRWAVKRFLEHKEKFCLIFRFNYELTECADKFYKDIHALFFPGHNMTQKRHANGTYVELFLDDKSCGYCLALNNADQLKRFSHLLSDSKRIIFDEFQSETNRYCANEITKLLSIHTSLARGGGEQVRYLPVIMIGNAVSLINPYFLELGISDRINSETKYLKGDGFVLEQGYYEEVSKEQQESGFNRAFAGTKYVAYASQNVYLLDNYAFIEKPSGVNRYICTVKVDGRLYSIKDYPQNGWYYIDTSIDASFPVKYTASPNDHEAGFIMVNTVDVIFRMLKLNFERGMVRFKNQQAKSALFTILRYSID